MKNRSYISVIITNYNYEQYISEAIESVLNQTYQHFELIIVDDGSMDNSLEIIQRYAALYPDKIKAVIKENGGQASSFNKGFEIAEGDIIAFLDADDYWYPEKLDKVVALHEQYNGIQHNILINGKTFFTFIEDGIAKQQDSLLKYGFLGVIPTSALSFRKDALFNVFPIPAQDYRICADLYIRNKFLLENDIYSLEEPLAFYRAHGSNNWYESSMDFSPIVRKTVELINNEIYPKEIPYELNGKSFIKYFWSTLEIQENARYIIYGTGAMGQHFMNSIMDSNGKFVGFTSSKVQMENFCDFPVFSISQIENVEVQYDYIIIASEKMGWIEEYVRNSTKIPREKVIYPKL